MKKHTLFLASMMSFFTITYADNTLLICHDNCWIRGEAGSGDAKAQLSLGKMYAKGINIYQSYTEAVKWFQKSAEQGNADAQAYLGKMYDNGTGVAQSNAEAIKWYRKAVEQGNADAQTYLGKMYYDGRGVNQSYEEAIKMYRKASVYKKRHCRGRRDLGEVCETRGNAEAQYNLGVMFDNGTGVTQSHTEAVEFYRRAAFGRYEKLGNFGFGLGYEFFWVYGQGHAGAQNSLGIMHEKGRGVTQSDIEAEKMFRKAAQQGHAGAQNSLGAMYDEGRGVTQSDAEAIRWYRKSAEQGLVKAQYNVGLMYEKGRGVAQSDAEAVRWYRKAADEGHDGAIKALVKMEK